MQRKQKKRKAFLPTGCKLSNAHVFSEHDK